MGKMSEHDEDPCRGVFDEIYAHPRYPDMVLELLDTKIRDLRKGARCHGQRHAGAAGEYLANAWKRAAQSLQRDRDMLRAAIDKRERSDAMRLDHYHHLDQHILEDLPDEVMALERERIRHHYAVARRAHRKALVEAGQEEES